MSVSETGVCSSEETLPVLVRREADLQGVLVIGVVRGDVAFAQRKAVAELARVDDAVLVGLVLGIFLVIEVVVEVCAAQLHLADFDAGGGGFAVVLRRGFLLATGREAEGGNQQDQAEKQGAE